MLAIDGTPVGPDVDIDPLLTLDDERDMVLHVTDASGTERDVTVRPVRSVRGLLYDEYTAGNRALVEELAGPAGLLAHPGHEPSSLRKMEEDLMRRATASRGF
ncbi:MAG: hypothetical protein R3E96_14490 [Planctomycetota bacterium]